MQNITNNATLLDVISNVMNFVYAIAPIVAVVYIFWGGVKYIMAAGNKEKAHRAGETVKHAVIGLIIIYTSYLIVRQVFIVLNVNHDLLAPFGFDFLPK
jgi:hypothetical protein